MAKEEKKLLPELDPLDDSFNSDFSEEELEDLAAKKAEDPNEEPSLDPFKCPDDDFLRSVWPIENKGFNSLRKYIKEGGGVTERTPLQNFGVDTRFYVCPGCKSNLTKGTSFWATSSFIGNMHVDKKPRLILCKKCVSKYYEKLLEHFDGNINKAMFQLCYDFDFYYDQYLVDKLVFWKYHDGSTHPDNKFPDTYLKIITNVGKANPYKGKTLFQQIGYDVFQQVINGQYDFAARKKLIEEQKQLELESTLSKEDRIHRGKVLATYLYDPFENYPPEEKPNLYRSLFMMLEDSDSIAQDLTRQRAALEIVTSYITLEKLNDKLQAVIQEDDNSKEAADNIAKWTNARANMASIIEKQARENGFSMRYSGGSGKGSGTLSGVQKELLDGFDDDLVTNYYDIKTSSSIKHIADISSKSIMEQLELGENDYVDMIKEQKEMIQKLTAEKDNLAEENRLIKAKLKKGRLLRELKQEYIAKGIDPSELNMILEDEYTVPSVDGDAPNGEE